MSLFSWENVKNYGPYAGGVFLAILALRGCTQPRTPQPSQPQVTAQDATVYYQQGLSEGSEHGFAEGLQQGARDALISPVIGDANQNVSIVGNEAEAAANGLVADLVCARRSAYLRAANDQTHTTSIDWTRAQLRHKVTEMGELAALVGQFDGSSHLLNQHGVWSLVIDHAALLETLKILEHGGDWPGCTISFPHAQGLSTALLLELERRDQQERDAVRFARERLDEVQVADRPGVTP